MVRSSDAHVVLMGLGRMGTRKEEETSYLVGIRAEVEAAIG